jgi:FlaA1/EpsC-like NDP-sugar epimerase
MMEVYNGEKYLTVYKDKVVLITGGAGAKGQI